MLALASTTCSLLHLQHARPCIYNMLALASTTCSLSHLQHARSCIYNMLALASKTCSHLQHARSRIYNMLASTTCSLLHLQHDRIYNMLDLASTTCSTFNRANVGLLPNTGARSAHGGDDFGWRSPAHLVSLEDLQQHLTTHIATHTLCLAHALRTHFQILKLIHSHRDKHVVRQHDKGFVCPPSARPRSHHTGMCVLVCVFSMLYKIDVYMLWCE